MIIDYDDGSFPARQFRNKEYPNDRTMIVWAIPHDSQFVVFPVCGFGSTEDVWILDTDDLLEHYEPLYTKHREKAAL